MKPGIKSFAAAAALFAAGAAGQFALARANPSGAPRVGGGIVAAMGGLRSVAAEAVWFRAERLQEQGRFAELVQLAALLTFLEPHVAEVWTYSAWNLAYNVSVRMPREEDRWPWVLRAIRLLRDDGLKWNPGDPDICRELAFMFELKIGAKMDSAAPLYREEWRKIASDVRDRGAWSELSMDPALMSAIEKEYGITDWTDAQASAIYWAKLGLAKADRRQAPFLAQILRQSLALYEKNRNTAKQ